MRKHLENNKSITCESLTHDTQVNGSTTTSVQPHVLHLSKWHLEQSCFSSLIENICSILPHSHSILSYSY